MTLWKLFGQVLLSHNNYHKTGSDTIVDDLHQLGHNIYYAETCFNEDKLAEWNPNKPLIHKYYFKYSQKH